MIRKIALAVLSIAVLTMPSFAIFGIGFHYSVIDQSVSLKDNLADRTVFDSLRIPVSGFGPTAPAGFSTLFPNASIAGITGNDLPITISRKKWESTPLHLGAKVYVDIIPIIDAIEISANAGLWQYYGMIKYPKTIAYKTTVAGTPTKFTDFVDVVYDSTTLTLDSMKVVLPSFMNLHNTPYVKVNFDLTVRKSFLKLPPVLDIVQIYAGGGPSLNFATPVLSSGLIKDALGAKLNRTIPIDSLGPAIFANQAVMADVVKEIMAKTMTPHFGMHIIAGVSVKPPVIPVAFYVDGKLTIPFGDLDVSKDLSGLGFLVNAGVAFAM